MDNETNPQKGLGCFPYIIACLSFIPLLGVPVGIIMIIYGLIKWSQSGGKLALIGLGGICFTIVLYGTLFYNLFKKDGGMFEDLKTQMAQSNLLLAIKELEYYKVQHGSYPEKLSELRQGKPTINQPLLREPYFEFGNMDLPYFCYELINEGNNYYLYSRGPDQIKDTTDDVFPLVSQGEAEKIGYRKKSINTQTQKIPESNPKTK